MENLFSVLDDPKTKVEAVLHFDGSCWPNPGPNSRGAFILKLPQGKVVARTVEFGEGTNNTAEYNSLIAGLEAALANGVTDLEVYGDSQLVVYGVRKGPSAKGKPHLEALKATAIELVKKFRNVDLNWVDREQNSECDELSRAETGVYQ